jgi:D-lyxose ketol-isomerase
MIVQVEAEEFDLGPGSSITIPPAALHTFTVLSPSVKFLVVSLTGAMGDFHTDLDATVPHDRPIEDAAQQIQQVLGRHDVTVAGLGEVLR